MIMVVRARAAQGPPREPSVDGVLLSDGHFYPEQQDRSGAQDVLVMPMPGSQ